MAWSETFAHTISRDLGGRYRRHRYPVSELMKNSRGVPQCDLAEERQGKVASPSFNDRVSHFVLCSHDRSRGLSKPVGLWKEVIEALSKGSIMSKQLG